MRYAIMADIHANLAAFNAVLDDMEQRGGVEEIWCLGDIVGYGPDPHECMERLQQYNHVCVAGNHDWAAIGKISTANFNPDAALACQWTTQQLSQEDIQYLESLSLVVDKDIFTLVHGSPREPIWEYVISTGIARENFSFFQSPYCLLGHSHVPLVFKEEDGSCTFSRLVPNIGLALGESRLIINPGGVGQPRDGDPRASYVIYDSDTRMVRLYRIPYDIAATQDKMMAKGLPVRLAVRLQHGM
ncbi:MAG TPA: metallophosphoesterase family protein [Dehalococcoidales bacterium]|nr:metallophosphoesterase family protein [Dehalococcoidales bacterium]